MTSTLVTLSDPTSPAAEAYRRLRLNLMSPVREASLRTLLVVAAGADAGKASVVANLAVTFARVGQRVILVDCDLRHPAQHTFFGLSNEEGLTTALPTGQGQQAGGVAASRASLPPGAASPTQVPADTGVRPDARGLPLQETGVPGLRLLASGPVVAVPSEWIASPLMAALIRSLRDDADLVLFDAPPVVLATDAAELATQVDGVLLTVSAGRTKRDDAQRARDLLAKVGARVLGAALVNAPVDVGQREYLAA